LKARKNQNSIIFLATLGVYLGLMLTGGTPQVFAHAALTRNFDMREEVETRDDQDREPHGDRSPVTASVQIYLEDIEYFLSSLGKLKDRGSFDRKGDAFNVAQTTMLPCVDSDLTGRYTPIRFNATSNASSSALQHLRRGMVYGYSLGDCISNSEFTVEAVDSRFNFGLDGKAFGINITVKKKSPERTLELVRQLQSTIKLYTTPSATTLRKSIVEHTSFRTDKDQVFIVTRLPRGSLESLLTDAK